MNTLHFEEANLPKERLLQSLQSQAGTAIEFYSEFFHSMYHEAVLSPLASINQLSGLNEAKFPEEPRTGQHGSLASELGTCAGALLDFAVVAKLTGGAFGRVSHSATALMDAREADHAMKGFARGLKSTTQGFTYGAVFVPEYTGQNKIDRLENGLLIGAAANFATMLKPMKYQSLSTKIMDLKGLNGRIGIQ